MKKYLKNVFEVSKSDHLTIMDKVTVSLINPDKATTYGCELTQLEETYVVKDVPTSLGITNLYEEDRYFIEQKALKLAHEDGDRLKKTYVEQILYMTM